jgi:ligand-binding sensor domain-containing protein
MGKITMLNVLKEKNAAKMWVVLILSSFLLVSCASSIFSTTGWQASGLQNQQLRVLEVSGKDARTLYAGNVQGHVFVSTDAGQHWVEQSSGLPLPDVIHALSFDTTGQKLYAATAQGLFTQTEGATLWKKVTAASLPSTDITSLTFLPDAPKVIYVGTSDLGVFVSNDGGTSWLPADSGLPHGVAINDLSFDPAQNQVWAATAVGAYRSANRGASWQSFNSGLPASILVNTIIPASASGGSLGLLYMGTNHGIFLSHDSGAHWTTGAESLAGVTIYAILVDFRSTNGTDVYIATSLGVFLSKDSGQNWQAVASGLPKSAPVYALVFGDANNAQLYVAGNGLYEFPGSGGGVDPLRIVTYLVIIVFFFLLYRLATRGRNTRRNMLKPERIQENPNSIPPADPAS